MQTRRVSRKMQSEHIASLGSVDDEVSVRERLVFWAKLPERFAGLGNRVGPDDQAKVYDHGPHFGSTKLFRAPDHVHNYEYFGRLLFSMIFKHVGFARYFFYLL